MAEVTESISGDIIAVRYQPKRLGGGRSYCTYTVGTSVPVTGLLTPPIRRVTGSASPSKCVPGMRQLIW